jgi:predicted RNA-binding protein with PUA-like domain
MQYWLMKTEPSCFSIDDLKRDKTGMWDGVRNYQARNFIQTMKKGDVILFYHSSEEPIGIVGEAIVAKEAYSDPTQFDAKADHYDPKSTKEKPRWSAVDVRFRKKYKHMLTLRNIKDDLILRQMIVAQTGSRLSVQPVSKKHYERILTLV